MEKAESNARQSGPDAPLCAAPLGTRAIAVGYLMQLNPSSLHLWVLWSILPLIHQIIACGAIGALDSVALPLVCPVLGQVQRGERG